MIDDDEEKMVSDDDDDEIPIGRSLSEEAEVEVEVFNNVVCKEITAGKVKVWPKKGKISSGKLSVKYAILNRIGAANWVPTKHTS
ncbi:envelope-like protein, partial [Trifolium medium]|nr:envelope-like protein [Trifolium medium]